MKNLPNGVLIVRQGMSKAALRVCVVLWKKRTGVASIFCFTPHLFFTTKYTNTNDKSIRQNLSLARKPEARLFEFAHYYSYKL